MKTLVHDMMILGAIGALMGTVYLVAAAINALVEVIWPAVRKQNRKNNNKELE